MCGARRPGFNAGGERDDAILTGVVVTRGGEHFPVDVGPVVTFSLISPSFPSAARD